MENTKSSNIKTKLLQQDDAGKGNSQLQKYFTDASKDLYRAEEKLVNALPKIQQAATSDELTSAIEDHITQTNRWCNVMLIDRLRMGPDH